MIGVLDVSETDLLSHELVLLPLVFPSVVLRCSRLVYFRSYRVTFPGFSLCFFVDNQFDWSRVWFGPLYHRSAGSSTDHAQLMRRRQVASDNEVLHGIIVTIYIYDKTCDLTMYSTIRKCNLYLLIVTSSIRTKKYLLVDLSSQS